MSFTDRASLQASEFGTSRSRSPNTLIKSKRGGLGISQTSNITPFPPSSHNPKSRLMKHKFSKKQYTALTENMRTMHNFIDS